MYKIEKKETGFWVFKKVYREGVTQTEASDQDPIEFIKKVKHYFNYPDTNPD